MQLLDCDVVSHDPPVLSEKEILELLDKQVDRYQTTAARLANNSVQVKTWCVTAVGALAAVAVNNHRSSLFLVALAILFLFMLLDVQYLWLERRFRSGAFELVAAVVGNDRDLYAAGGRGAPMRAFFANRAPSVEGEKRPGVTIRKLVKNTLHLQRVESAKRCCPSQSFPSTSSLPHCSSSAPWQREAGVGSCAA